MFRFWRWKKAKKTALSIPIIISRKSRYWPTIPNKRNILKYSYVLNQWYRKFLTVCCHFARSSHLGKKMTKISTEINGRPEITRSFAFWSSMPTLALSSENCAIINKIDIFIIYNFTEKNVVTIVIVLLTIHKCLFLRTHMFFLWLQQYTPIWIWNFSTKATEIRNFCNPTLPKK